MLERKKTRITAKLHRTDLVIYSHSREGKTSSYSRIAGVLGSTITMKYLTDNAHQKTVYYFD